MLYRVVPKTGDRLSILGFGCMRLPGKRGKIDEGRATGLIRHAIDQGVNYIDTAMPYHRGASEPFLARALTGGYREKIRLSTKLPHWLARSRSDFDELLRAQLERLDTERIDYYLIHALEAGGWKRIKDLGLLRFLDEAKSDGRILHTGFSFHGARASFREIVDDYDWDCCLIQYNFLDEQNQAGTEGLEYAAARGLGVLVMEPLRGGLLGRTPPGKVQAIWEQAPVKRTPAEWALRWVWNRPEVTVILSGMNDESHLEENLANADEALPDSLTEEELQLVSRAAQIYRRLMKVKCTGCGYCMPCPAGVNIPTCFEAYNSAFMSGNRWIGRTLYLVRLTGRAGRMPAFASLCTDCGKCEEACPQHLPIPALLKDVAKEFEGLGLTAMTWVVKTFMRLQRRRALRAARLAQRRKRGAVTR